MDFYYVKIAFYATLFTWFVTALGASMVFLFKKVSNKIMSLMFGFGAGVMIAASFFSLILPGIELADEMNQIRCDELCELLDKYNITLQNINTVIEYFTLKLEALNEVYKEYPILKSLSSFGSNLFF